MRETKSKKQDARERQENLNDICAVMDTAEGRRFVWRVLENSHMFETSYGGRTNDFIFNEGERNIGLWLFNELLEANSELYLLMQKEQIDKDKAKALKAKPKTEEKTDE